MSASEHKSVIYLLLVVPCCLLNKTLDKLIPAINVDGTLNKKETIKHYVNLELKVFGQPQMIRLLVTGLGKQKILQSIDRLANQHFPMATCTRSLEI